MMIALALRHWRQLLLAFAVAGAFAGGWTASSLRWSATVAAERLARSEAARLAQDAARAQSAQWAAEAAAADARHTQTLQESQNEIAALRAAVAAGSVRLRVRARCPAADGVPGPAASPGVGDAGSAQLAADAGADYYALLGQLSLMEGQLRACQDLLRLGTPPPP